MNKSEKIAILDELIEKTNRLNYSKNNPQSSIKDNVLSFVRNSLSKTNSVEWIKRIDDIRWNLSAFSYSTPESAFKEAWENGKLQFINLLKSIKFEVELYDPNDTERVVPIDRTPIIFLSHCSSDKQYADILEKFIIGLGVKNNQLIYTSHPLHKVPFDTNIYDYLRKNIYKDIYMIILWSNKYLESPGCLNEMGAAWVTQNDYSNVFLPTFSFGNPKFHECAVDTRKMGAVLNADEHCKANMIELKDKIQSLFELENNEKQTAYLLDIFIKEIISIK